MLSVSNDELQLQNLCAKLKNFVKKKVSLQILVEQ